MKDRTLMIVSASIFALIMLGLTVWAGISPQPAQGQPLAAATVVSVQTIVTTGISPTLNAASLSGNSFTNDGRTVLDIHNDSANTLYYTVTVPYTVGGLAVANLTGTVSGGQQKFVGPFNKTIYDGAGGAVTINWSSGTSVSFAVLTQ